MTQTEGIVRALKQRMRSQGITYRQAAKALGLSEVSIKRLFSERSFSLQRLEALCDLAETDLGELVQLAEAAQHQLDTLSQAQERELVEDSRLLLVAVCIVNHMSFQDILDKYDFDEPGLIRLFARLDRMGIVEFLPGNRYRLKLNRRFRLQPGGPIQIFFINNLMKEFLNPGQSSETTPFQLAWGMISKSSALELQRRIQRLIDDYLQIAEHDARIPVEDKLTSSLFIMFREDMEPAMFKAQRKP